jgi:hypothetical protein
MEVFSKTLEQSDDRDIHLIKSTILNPDVLRRMDDNSGDGWIVLLKGNNNANESVGTQLQRPELDEVIDKSKISYIFDPSLLHEKSDLGSGKSTEMAANLNKAKSRLSSYAVVHNKKTLSGLISSGMVEYYEPNHTYKVEKYTEQDLGAIPWHFSLLNIMNAWRKSTGEGVKVAVIDTGIEYEHDELRSAVAINSSEDINNDGIFQPWPSDSVIAGVSGDLNGIDDDGNGYPDDVIGYDFVDLDAFDLGDYSEPDPLPFDEHGHGTAMSSLIAAAPDGKNITGVAPDSKIISVRSFDSRGNGESDDIARGIIYAVATGVKIINMSFGDNFESMLVRDAIAYAEASGVLMISSAGNSASYFRAFPSDYPSVVSVGGVDKNGGRYGRSNFGSMIDIASPSVELPVAGLDNGYRTSTGTSAGAALISGIAALVLSSNPDLSAEGLESALISSAEDFGENGWDQFYGVGIPNANKAIEYNRDAILRFETPRYGELFKSTDDIRIIATIATPLFSDWELSYTEGYGVILNNEEPEWTRISEGTDQGINIQLNSGRIAPLDSGQVTIRLVVNQTNGINFEKRLYIDIVPDNADLSLLRDTVYNTYADGQPSYTIHHRTSYPTYYSTQLLEDKKGVITSPRGTANNGLDHLFDITSPTVSEDFTLIAEYYGAGDTLRNMTGVTSAAEGFDVNAFDIKPYTIPFSYIKGEVYRHDGSDYIPATDYEGLNFGDTKIYRFTGTEFEEVWSSEEGGLFRAAGDMNGDGEPELLTTIDFGAKIYSHSAENNPFDNEVFSTGVTERIWGLDMADIDGDGDMEAILLGSGVVEGTGLENSFEIVDYVEGEYQVFSVPLLMEGQDGNTGPAISLQNESAILDIDRDDFIEIVLAHFDGRVVIYDLPRDLRNGINQPIEPIYQSDDDINESDHYFTVGDFQGGDDLEVAIMGYGQSGFTGEETAGHGASNVRILSYDNTFELGEPYFFRSTRNTLGLHWGIGSADLYPREGDELIVNAFPYSYIFGKDTLNGLEPLFSFYGALSRTAIEHDFDNNGRNEVLINTFGQVFSFEYDPSNISVPVITDLVLTSPNTVSLHWLPTKEGNYAVGLQEVGIEDISIIGELNGLSTIINDLDTNKTYNFYLAAIGSEGYGPLSEPISVTTGPRISPEEITKLSDYVYQIKYTGYLPKYLSNQDVYASHDGQYYYPRTIYSNQDSLLFVYFNDILPADTLVFTSENFQDRRGMGAVRKNLSYFNSSNFTETEQLTITSASLIGRGNLLEIRLSHPVTDPDAIAAATYSLSPFGEIIDVGSSISDPFTLQANISSGLARRGRGFEYCLEIEGLVSDSGVQVAEDIGNKACFTIPVEDFSDVYAYPQPWDRSVTSQLMISNVLNDSEVIIFDISGNIIATLVERDNNGGVEWNGMTASGQAAEPGIYFYRVKSINDTDGEDESTLLKFAITK